MVLVLVSRMLAWLVGNRGALNGAWFDYVAPGHVAAYRAMFQRAPMQFGQCSSGLAIPLALTRLPVLRSEDQGADSVVWLTAARDADTLTGKFIHDRRPRPTHRGKRTRHDGAQNDQFMAMLTADAAPYTTGDAGDSRKDNHGTNR